MTDRYQHDLRTTGLDPDLLSTPFGVQTNWHVIAGAQSCGKTTLIDLLADHGYQTLTEGGRLYIETELARGQTVDQIWEDVAALQHGIMDTQLSLEGELRATDTAFLDRGLPDCLAWCRVYGLDPNAFLTRCFRHRYASVFVLDRLPIHGDGLRPEDEDVAVFLDQWIERDYRALGYDVVRVPVMALEERLAFVLKRLTEQGLL